MSESISNVERELFAADVKHAYQGNRKIFDKIRRKENQGAKTWHFPAAGKTTAVEKLTHAGLETPTGVAYSDVTLTPRNFYAKDYSDIFEAEKVNFEDRMELAKAISMAIGRRQDQLVIDAVEAASVSKSVAKSIGGSNTGMNMAKVRRARRLFLDDEIEESLCIVAHSLCSEDLLADEEATSADYQNIRALVNGEINHPLGGFRWIFIGNRTEEGGLDLTSNTRSNFAFAESAIVGGVNLQETPNIYWADERGAWGVTERFSANSEVREVAGVVDVLTHEA